MTSYVGSESSAPIDTADVRQVLFACPHFQIVVMNLAPGEDIGREQHATLDQFLRVEQGEGDVVFDDAEHHRLRDGDAILVPAGIWHTVINTSSSVPLRLHTLYSPPRFARPAVHATTVPVR